jgi:hypothetical protein
MIELPEALNIAGQINENVSGINIQVNERQCLIQQLFIVLAV